MEACTPFYFIAMGAPFTQEFIQTKIEFFAAQLEVATKGQEKSYDQGPTGQFGIKKAELDQIQESLNTWIGYMDKYYPDAFAVNPRIELTEIGYVQG